MEDLSHSHQTHGCQDDSNPEPADHHRAAFRFLDLPPEVRNLIYGQLLMPQPDRPSPSSCFGFCHPGIISTCRQIHNEAAGLLLGNTEQPINILFHADWVKAAGKFLESPAHTTELLKTVQIHNYGVYNAKETEFEQLPNGFLAYPSYLRRVKRLHIEVNVVANSEEYYYGLPFIGSAAFARACIHTLVSFLMQGHSLRELRVKFTALSLGGYSPHPRLLNALQPLQRLRNIDVVNVIGFINGSEITPMLWAPMIKDMRTKTDSPPTNILNKMQEVYRLCNTLVKWYDYDADDERKAEHELLKIFYRYIMWELHFEGNAFYCRELEFQIFEHLSWMQLRIVKLRKQDREASPNQQRSCEQTESSAQPYWEGLNEAPKWPWYSCSRDTSTRRQDLKLMEASRGSQQSAVLNELKKRL